MRTLVIAVVIFMIFFHGSLQANSQEPCHWLNVDYTRTCGAVENRKNLFRLQEKDDCATMEIAAESFWNASGIVFEKDVSYRIEVEDPKAEWTDASIDTTAKGWYLEGTQPKDEICHGRGISVGFLKRVFINGTKWLRRAPDHDWFCLIGIVKGEREEQFAIGTKTDDFKSETEGEFCSFANDLSFMYFNNSGSLQLTITRLTQSKEKIK